MNNETKMFLVKSSVSNFIGDYNNPICFCLSMEEAEFLVNELEEIESKKRQDIDTYYRYGLKTFLIEEIPLKVVDKTKKEFIKFQEKSKKEKQEKLDKELKERTDCSVKDFTRIREIQEELAKLKC